MIQTREARSSLLACGGVGSLREGVARRQGCRRTGHGGPSGSLSLVAVAVGQIPDAGEQSLCWLKRHPGAWRGLEAWIILDECSMALSAPRMRECLVLLGMRRQRWIQWANHLGVWDATTKVLCLCWYASTATTRSVSLAASASYCGGFPSAHVAGNPARREP